MEHQDLIGVEVVSTDPTCQIRHGVVIAVESKARRGVTEPRIHVRWKDARNATWLRVAGEGVTWRRA